MSTTRRNPQPWRVHEPAVAPGRVLKKKVGNEIPASVSLRTVIPSLSKQQHYMIRNFVAALFALTVLVSCVSGPMVPVLATRLISPSPNRRRLNSPAVAWTFILTTSAKTPLPMSAPGWRGPASFAAPTRARKTRAAGSWRTPFSSTTTSIGVQNNNGHGVTLFVSPRGEGLFRAKWRMDKVGRDATAASAEKYAGPGKLALVYGVPEKVNADGTVVLKYRYLRILGADQFSTNQFDYGRFGASFCAIQSGCKTNSPPLK